MVVVVCVDSMGEDGGNGEVSGHKERQANEDSQSPQWHVAATLVCQQLSMRDSMNGTCTAAEYPPQDRKRHV